MLIIFRYQLLIYICLSGLFFYTKTSFALPAALLRACDAVLQNGWDAEPQEVQSHWQDVVTAQTPTSQILKLIEKTSEVKGSETIALRTKPKALDQQEFFHRARRYPAFGKEKSVLVLLGGLDRSLEVMHNDVRSLISGYQKSGVSVLVVEILGQGLSQVIHYLREESINHEDPIDFENQQVPSTLLAIRQALIRFGYLEAKKNTPELPIHLSGESYSGQLTARVANEMPQLFSSWTPIVSGALSTGQVMLNSMMANYSATLVSLYIERAEGYKIRQQKYYRDDLFKHTSALMEDSMPSLTTDQIVRNGVIRLINGMLLNNAFEDIPQLPGNLQKNFIVAETDQILPPIIHYWLHVAARQVQAKNSRLILVRGAGHTMLNDIPPTLAQLLIKLNLKPNTLPDSLSGVYDFDLNTEELKPMLWVDFKSWTLERSNQWLNELRRNTPKAAPFLRGDFTSRELSIAPQWTGLKDLTEPSLPPATAP